MAIPEAHVRNFETLRRAFKNGDVALCACEDTRTSHEVYVICAVNTVLKDGDDVEYQFIPFGLLDPSLSQFVSDPVTSHHSEGSDA